MLGKRIEVSEHTSSSSQPCHTGTRIMIRNWRTYSKGLEKREVVLLCLRGDVTSEACVIAQTSSS